jgi:hypothetical protein
MDITNSYLQRNNAYLARLEISKIKDYLTTIDPNRLEIFGYKVYSQGDEDGIIDAIFHRLGIKKGTFAEIGVENGLECNTLLLLHQGWKGFWFEANEEFIKQIHYKFGSVVNLGIGVGMITKENINTAFEQVNIIDLDFLSIDIDGMDIYLLEALEIKPKVICIEYNAKWPAHVSKKPVYDSKFQWSGTDYMGSSLKAITDVANQKGYELVGTSITGANAFYVRKDLINDKFPKYREVSDLYNPPRYWLIFDHFWHIGHPADFGPYTDA